MARILVEDNPDLATALADFLAGEGHAVTVAFDGLAALQAIRDGRLDLLVTDIQMPMLGGLAPLDRLAHEGIPVPVILAAPRARAAVDPGGVPNIATRRPRVAMAGGAGSRSRTTYAAAGVDVAPASRRAGNGLSGKRIAE